MVSSLLEIYGPAYRGRLGRRRGLKPVMNERFQLLVELTALEAVYLRVPVVGSVYRVGSAVSRAARSEVFKTSV